MYITERTLIGNRKFTELASSPIRVSDVINLEHSDWQMNATSPRSSPVTKTTALYRQTGCICTWPNGDLSGPATHVTGIRSAPKVVTHTGTHTQAQRQLYVRMSHKCCHYTVYQLLHLYLRITAHPCTFCKLKMKQHVMGTTTLTINAQESNAYLQPVYSDSRYIDCTFNTV